MDQPEKQDENQIDDSLKLTGFARFSIRLHLLRKLALSDDPIKSLIAKRLMTDRLWRRVGGAFEFILVAILPLSGLISALQGSWMGYPASGLYSFVTLFTALNWLFGFIALLAGAFTAILPGKVLITPEQLRSDWKALPFDDTLMFKAITSVQLRSYYIPLLISQGLHLLALIIPLSITIVGPPGMLHVPAQEIFIMQLAGIVTSLVGNFAFMIVGIYTSLSQRIFWGSFIAFLVIQFLSYILGTMIQFILISAFSFMGRNDVSYLIFNYIGDLIIYFIFLWVFYIFAVKAVRKLTMPEK